MARGESCISVLPHDLLSLATVKGLVFVNPTDPQATVSVTVLGGSPFALCYIMRTVAAGPGASPSTGVVQPSVYAPPPHPVGASEASGMDVRSVRAGMRSHANEGFPTGLLPRVQSCFAPPNCWCRSLVAGCLWMTSYGCLTASEQLSDSRRAVQSAPGQSGGLDLTARWGGPPSQRSIHPLRRPASGRMPGCPIALAWSKKVEKDLGMRGVAGPGMSHPLRRLQV